MSEAEQLVAEERESEKFDKHSLDDWELTQVRKTVSNPLTKTLLGAIGDGPTETKGRTSRINTSENFETQSELKSEIGRYPDFAVEC